MIRHFWLFARPQTILASGTSMVIIYIITAQTAIYWPSWFWLSLLSAMLCNVFITGFNQLIDIRLDELNNPETFSPTDLLTAKKSLPLVFSTLVLSLAIAALLSWYYTFFIAIIASVGFAYSWKKTLAGKRDELSTLAIILFRGILINLGFTLHYLYMAKMPLVIPNGVWLLTAGLFFFSLGLSWFKNIPSIKGDDCYDKNSLDITVGIVQSFKGGVVAIFTGYLITILVAIFTDIPSVNNWIIIIGQGFLAFLFLILSKRTEPNEHKSISRFYKLFWLLVPLTYLVFGLSAISLY